MTSHRATSAPITTTVHGSAAMTARLSRAAAGTFVLLLAVLHILRPDLDPTWRFISEYAVGDHGWIMVLAFLSLAISFIALFIALRSEVRTMGGRIGLFALLISATGLIIAAIFPTDPVTTTPDAMTTSGKLHSLGGALGIAMPFAAALISWNLARNPGWAHARRSVVWTAALALVATLAFIAAVAVMVPGDGVFGPELPVAWVGRLEILAYSVWLMTVARRVEHRRTYRAGGRRL
jgi:hypothetical protein